MSLNPSLAGTTSPILNNNYMINKLNAAVLILLLLEPLLRFMLNRLTAAIAAGDVLILLLLEPLLRFGKVSSGGVYFLKS